MSRTSARHRATGETDVRVRIDLDGTGNVSASTGIGFFDHMLTLLGRHALVDLEVEARGDLETGGHHTVEDVGIVLGGVIDEALGDRSGLERYGSAALPMDEVLVLAAVDLSGRPFAAIDVPLPVTTVGGFESDLLEEFLRAVAVNARAGLHVRTLADGGPHHVIEAAFKATARALRQAVARDGRETGVPSTKGAL